MDCIRIENLEIYAHHGVMQEENVLGQKFLLSVEMETDTCAAGCSDALEHSTDYGEVAHFIKDYFETHQWKLLEAAAHHLCEQLLLQFNKIWCVNLEIKKPWAPILLPLEFVSVRVERRWHKAYLSIGSNMGDREQNLRTALDALQADERTRVTRVSKFLVTEPVGGVEQEDFLNGAVEIATLRTPEQLLELVAQIEEQMGRKRTVHWGARNIDLDIVLYEDIVMDTEKLTIPHKEMLNRQFVLEPLCEIAPQARHPYAQMSIYQLWNAFQQGS